MPLFGAYGWPDLQIVLTRDVGIAMEHTALIMTPPTDYVVTHELAHEWWYALIGDDQARDPWLDEAFASYSEEAAGAQSFPWCRRPGEAPRVVTRSTAFFRERRYGVRAHLRRGRACSTCRCASGSAPRASPSRCAATRWRTATAGRPAPVPGGDGRRVSIVPLDDLWRRYRVVSR